MGTSERKAWEALGWTAQSWAGERPAPLSSWRHWHELSSAEQAAAAYGLGYKQATWDQQLDDELHGQSAVAATAGSDAAASSSATAPPAATSSAARPPGAEPLDGAQRAVDKAADLGRKGLPWLRAAAQLLPRGSKLRGAAEILADAASAVQGAALGQVAVQGVEDVVYLDDSGSMSGGCLTRAQGLWHELAVKLQANPCRVVKFGSYKSILQARREGVSGTAIALAWNAESGATYMWHMILEDILQSYKPGPGRLRVFVVTDGGDTGSPPPYRGMRGMDPMMREVRRLGFNVEFYIVFVSDSLAQAVLGAIGRAFGAESLGAADLDRYRDLALATGGGFLHLSGSESEEERLAFLARAADGAGKEEARREYERRLSDGDATKFDWYERLPPPR